jgi:hypothetical protein
VISELELKAECRQRFRWRKQPNSIFSTSAQTEQKHGMGPDFTACFLRQQMNAAGLLINYLAVSELRNRPFRQYRTSI